MKKKKSLKKYPEGGVNTLEGDLISKVIMNRNRDKNFVQRANYLGEYPDTPMFTQLDANQFGDKNSHLMAWGEGDNGQAYMFPTIMNPNNESIKVPNQYADYISSEGYKNATGMKYSKGGKVRSLKKYSGGGLTQLMNDDGSALAPGGQAALALAGGAAGAIGQGGEEAGQSIGTGIGNAAGMALNAVVPGLGFVAGPILGKLGGMAGKAIGDWADNGPEKELEKQKRIKNSIESFNNSQKTWSNNTQLNNNFTYANGGLVIDEHQPNATAELELNEQFQTPDGQVGEVNGPSHAEGGIEVNLEDGTRVFSDRLKHNGKTFAQYTKPINTKIDRLQKNLESNPNDKLKQNSLMLMNKQLDHYFAIQEQQKQNTEMKRSIKYAKGGLVKYGGQDGRPGVIMQRNQGNPYAFGSDEFNDYEANAYNFSNNQTSSTPSSKLSYPPTSPMEGNWNINNNPAPIEGADYPGGPYSLNGPGVTLPYKPASVQEIPSSQGFLGRKSLNLNQGVPGFKPLSPVDMSSVTKSKNSNLEKFGNFLESNSGEIGQIGSSLISTALQNRNVNKLNAPRTLGKVNLKGQMTNPNLVDYSAQRNAITRASLSQSDAADKMLTNSAAALAYKNKNNLDRIEGVGKSYQDQFNTNAQIENAFLQQRNQAAMQEELANNEIDKYNNENIYGYDQNKLGMKNQLIGQVGNTAGQVFGNQTKYANELKQANIMARGRENAVNVTLYGDGPEAKEYFKGLDEAGKKAYNDRRIAMKIDPIEMAYGGTIRSFAKGGTVGEKYRQAMLTQPTLENAQAMDAEYASYLDEKGMPTQKSFKSKVTGLDYKVLPKGEKDLLAANLWKEAHGNAPTKKQVEATKKAIEGKPTSSARARSVADMVNNVWPEAELSQEQKNQYTMESAYRGIERPAPLKDESDNYRSEAIESQGSLIEDFISPEGLAKIGVAAIGGLGMGWMKKQAMKGVPKLGKEVLEGKVKRTIIDEIGEEGYKEMVKKAGKTYGARQANANKRSLKKWAESGQSEFLDKSTSPEFQKKLTKRISDVEDEMLPYDMMNKKLDDMEIPSFGSLREKEILKDLTKAKKAGDIKLFEKIMKEYRRNYNK